MAFSCSSASLIARLISLAMAFLVVASCSQSCHNIGRFFGGVILPAKVNASAPITFFSSGSFFRQPCGLTKRAPDARGVCPTFEYFFWLRVFSTSQAESTPTHTQVTQTVRPSCFSFLLKTVSLVKCGFFAFACNRGFPAIVLSAVSTSIAFFSLLVFSS